MIVDVKITTKAIFHNYLHKYLREKYEKVN